MIITLIGMPGCGKTTVGGKIARHFGYKFIDADFFIEEKYKMSINSIFKAVGESGFRKLETHILSEILENDNIVFATGGGLPCFYSNIDTIILKSTSIYINLTPKMIANRLSGSKRKRPLTANKTDAEILSYVENTLASREKYYQKAHFTVDTSKENIINFLKLNIKL